MFGESHFFCESQVLGLGYAWNSEQWRDKECLHFLMGCTGGSLFHLSSYLSLWNCKVSNTLACSIRSDVHFTLLAKCLTFQKISWIYLFLASGMKRKWGTLQALSQNCEKQLLALSCTSVCPYETVQRPPFFRKSVDRINLLLKSDKNNGYFTWRHMHITSGWIFPSMNNVSDKLCRECENTHEVQLLFRKWCLSWNNVGGKQVVQPERPQMKIRRMGLAC